MAGVYHPPPEQRDPTQFVMEGAAAQEAAAGMATWSIAASTVRPPLPPAPSAPGTLGGTQQVTSATLPQEKQRIAATKLRRQKELDEANCMIQMQQQQMLQKQNAQLAHQHQQLLEAERAEELAHRPAGSL